MVYSLFIFKTDSGTFDGYFPDVEGCFFAGNTIEEATQNAASALQAHLAFLVDEGMELPPPPKRPEEYIGDARLCEDDGYLVGVEIKKNSDDVKKTKLNITIPVDVLDGLNAHIRSRGFTNRSAFITALIRKEITRNTPS